MWQPEKYPKSLVEALALHSLLYSLGYCLREEVVIIFATNGDVLVELRAEGRVAPIRIGRAEHPPEKMRDEWVAIMKEWNTGGTATQADKDRLCLASKAWRNRVFIGAVLFAHGFRREPRQDDPMLSRN